MVFSYPFLFLFFLLLHFLFTSFITTDPHQILIANTATSVQYYIHGTPRALGYDTCLTTGLSSNGDFHIHTWFDGDLSDSLLAMALLVALARMLGETFSNCLTSVEVKVILILWISCSCSWTFSLLIGADMLDRCLSNEKFLKSATRGGRALYVITCVTRLEKKMMAHSWWTMLLVPWHSLLTLYCGYCDSNGA